MNLIIDTSEENIGLTLSLQHALTRSSATAQGPRDALC